MLWAWQMDCCRPKTGIAAPPCCDAEQHGGTVAATLERRQLQTLLVPSAARVVSPAADRDDPRRIVATQRIDAGAAPPGRTLVAQHTSLLL